MAAPAKTGTSTDPLLSCRDLERLASLQSRVSRTYFRLVEADRGLRTRTKARPAGVGAIVADSLEAERRRLGRELHTGVGQTIAGIHIHAGLIESSLPDPPEPVRKSLDRILKLADMALEQVRGVSRGLYVPAWQALPIVDALRNLWDASGVPERFIATLDLHAPTVEPPLQVRRALFLAAQEGISNAIQHASARHVHLSLREFAGHIVLEVEDDGSGLRAAPDPTQSHASSGIGLRAMRDLARELGGEFQMRNSPRGARLSIAFPLMP